jgi:peptidoglycan hydrolase CwlO-like protein
MKLVNSVLTLSLLPLCLTAVAQDASHQCPHMMNSTQHMSHETTSTSGLSDEQRTEYVNGEGMGLARPAELNHYPGPRHVLDNADKLQLSADQLAKTQALFQEVHTKAQALGKEIVAKEDELDSLFRDQRADVEKVSSLTSEIARLQGELRALHLSMHIRERAVLSPEQVAKYDSLRNYVPGSNPAPVHQR